MALAIQTLAKDANISKLASANDVSRKYLYQQKGKACDALREVFAPDSADEEVLFSIPVTTAWLDQFVVSLTLTCHSSYRGVLQFVRDLLGVSISLGSVHNLLERAAKRALELNGAQDLSAIRVGLNDEIFHCNEPVLAGVDARSTYCYLLAAEQHRDGDAWATHLLCLRDQGLDPDFFIGDQGTGLRAGQAQVWDAKPCHGDVFHIVKQCEELANVLARMAQGATTRLRAVQTKMEDAKAKGVAHTYAVQLGQARKAEEQMARLARDIKTLTQWLNRDVLELAGPGLATRLELFDFVVAEIHAREYLDPERIRKVRVALQNQRDDLLAFAAVLDEHLDCIAHAYEVSAHLVRQACLLQRKPDTSNAFWQGWNQLCAQMGHKCHDVFEAVMQAMAQTPRCSSMVENLNSRLRNYFTLRRQLGGNYLELLKFFLNHRAFMRSRVPERVGKSPRQLMTGEVHPHWLTMLGFGPLQPQRS